MASFLTQHGLYLKRIVVYLADYAMHGRMSKVGLFSKQK